MTKAEKKLASVGSLRVLSEFMAEMEAEEDPAKPEEYETIQTRIAALIANIEEL